MRTFIRSLEMTLDENGLTYFYKYSKHALISFSFNTFSASRSLKSKSNYSLVFYFSSPRSYSSSISSWIISSIISSSVTIPITFFTGSLFQLFCLSYYSLELSSTITLVTMPICVSPSLKYPRRGSTLSVWPTAMTSLTMRLEIYFRVMSALSGLTRIKSLAIKIPRMLSFVFS